MNYFTADLLGRFGSEDETTANDAQHEWEQACRRYGVYLDSIKGSMPSGLRQNQGELLSPRRQGPQYGSAEAVFRDCLAT